MPTSEALEYAQKQELDLVEVAPLSKPPVCKVMDYGNYLYNLKNKTKNSKKVRKCETITIRLSIRTDTHDLEIKAKQARKFLEGRNLIKVALIFKGREITHIDLGEQKMKDFFALLEDIAIIEQAPKKTGFQMIMILNPLK